MSTEVYRPLPFKDKLRVTGQELARTLRDGARRLLRFDNEDELHIPYARQIGPHEWLADLNLREPSQKVPLEKGKIIVMGRWRQENKTGPNMQRINIVSSLGGIAINRISRDHARIVFEDDIPVVQGIGQIPLVADTNGQVSLHGPADEPVALTPGTTLYLQEKFEGGYIKVSTVQEAKQTVLLLQRVHDEVLANQISRIPE